MAYLVPAAPAEAELRAKGSRFLALLVPAGNEAAARAQIEAAAARHDGASHCCWAWRLGAPARERCHDAGEPRGTAGPPILRALQAAQLSDALLLVMRWFGGTKLGKGGLVRAYGAAARAAIAAAPARLRLRRLRVTLRPAYSQVGSVQRLLRPPEVELVEELYGEGICMVLAVAEERLEEVRDRAAAIGLEIDVGTDQEPAAGV
jgi:uncharacterized YigZ family protein